jgi:hypothetical protein
MTLSPFLRKFVVFLGVVVVVCWWWWCDGGGVVVVVVPDMVGRPHVPAEACV